VDVVVVKIRGVLCAGVAADAADGVDHNTVRFPTPGNPAGLGSSAAKARRLTTRTNNYSIKT
jgi:hypothetical protein